MRYRLDTLVGCYQPVISHTLTQEEALSSDLYQLPDIPGEYLNGAPECPWCGNPGAGHCGNCGTIFCNDVSDPADIQCPGCNTILKKGAGGERGSFRVRQSGG